MMPGFNEPAVPGGLSATLVPGSEKPEFTARTLNRNNRISADCVILQLLKFKSVHCLDWRISGYYGENYFWIR